MNDAYTYEQARVTLGVSMSTLKRAIHTGVLTPVKKEKSTVKYLSKEQVDSFKGKSLKASPRTKNRAEKILDGFTNATYGGTVEGMDEGTRAFFYMNTLAHAFEQYVKCCSERQKDELSVYEAARKEDSANLATAWMYIQKVSSDCLPLVLGKELTQEQHNTMSIEGLNSTLENVLNPVQNVDVIRHMKEALSR